MDALLQTSAVARTNGRGVEMSTADLHDETGDIWVTVQAVPGPLDPRPSVDDVMPLAPVDQNGGIARSFLWRQPVRIVAGRIDGGYTNAFEVICYDCGDNPYLDYSEVSPQLQRLRGPYTLREGFAAYEKHLAARRTTCGPKKHLPNRRRR